MTPQQLFDAHKKLILHNANEAETRQKLIDSIIYELLGWNKDDITPEDRVSEDGLTTYADYVIRTGTTSLVIEAKKIGATFTGLENKSQIRLSGKFMTGEIGDAIRQARDYARKLSIPFAVVTNGAEWIICICSTRCEDRLPA